MGRETPSQTLGPYFSMILAHDDTAEDMATDATPGDAVMVTGRVLDGEGGHVEDALVEVWQADAEGRYHHPLDAGIGDASGFTGFGRSKTRFEDGSWRVRTIRPGPVPAPDGGTQAPHLNVVVQARGMLGPLFTRMYFPEDTDLHAADPVLAAVPADRRSTLVAQRDGSGYTFDIRLQGDGETVFLDF